MYDRDKVKAFMNYVLGYVTGDEPVPLAPEGYTVSEKDLLADLESFAGDVYDGKVTLEEGGVKVDFANGQTFRLSVEEIKYDCN